MKNRNLLLIFVKNPERGKVKTRLAKTIGIEKAYRTYLKLLKFTVETAAAVNVQKQIWYSSFIDKSDGFLGKPSDRFERSDGSNIYFDKKLQQGEDLGERMHWAFKQGFDEGFEKILIVGSDCPGITAEIIEEGFRLLEQNDVVVGPSEDGGYYLIGSNRMIPELFRDIPWSSKDVYPETISTLKKNNLSYSTLPILNDIDTEEDLRKSDFEFE